MFFRCQNTLFVHIIEFNLIHWSFSQLLFCWHKDEMNVLAAAYHKELADKIVPGIKDPLELCKKQ